MRKCCRFATLARVFFSENSGFFNTAHTRAQKFPENGILGIGVTNHNIHSIFINHLRGTVVARAGKGLAASDFSQADNKKTSAERGQRNGGSV